MKSPFSLKQTFLCLVLTTCFVPAFSQASIVAYGSSWKYLDNGSDQGTAWRGTGFSDAGWASGNAELGYGDGDEATVVSYGGNAANKFVTTYFRKTINIPDPTVYSNFTLNIEYDDGAVVYVNGTEVARARMTGSVLFTTLADAPAIEDQISNFTIPTSSFSAGTNVIAVEIHQQAVNSSDISFNLQLLANDAFSGTLTRGPYLQMGNQSAITIHWRTSAAQDTKVEVGTVFGTYPTVVTNGTSTTEHIIRVTGLATDTKYYYRIGNSTNMGAPDATYFFTTLPASNTTRKIRIAAFGDCGKGDATYQSQTLAQYQSFLTTNGIDAPDAWLILGDNAYNAGLDAEYTSNFFGSYGPNILKNHKVYPVPGNHDYANDATRQDDHAIPYLSIFDLPSAAECGGLASGKEEYYSYDIGDIHFLALDAYGEEGNKRIYTAGSPEAAWVVNDLAATTKKWKIAYWHHPPYTMGSHNSDSEGELVSMRTNFISLLENAGVDLIICGHSHDYERSYLIKGHYGLEATFNAGTHAMSTSSAKYTSAATCPYVYNTTPANHGTVYVVAGSTGASGGVQAGYPHNAFPYSVNDGGFFYFEIEDNRLDAKFIRRDGSLFDNFTIMKNVNKSTSYTIANGATQKLDASWPQSGTYTWTPSVSTNRSVNVSPPPNAVTNYTVTDAFGCVTDQFSVTTSSTLAVTLVSFDVKLVDKKASIKWTTATETNNNYFTIERSADARNYAPIGTVNGAGNTGIQQSYSFVDAFPLLGQSYYRLSQTDFDTHQEYLGVRRIENKTDRNFDVKVLSAMNSNLVLQINSSVQGIYQLQVFDMAGRRWKNESINVSAGITRKEITLPKGVYTWEVKNEKGGAVLQKVIIF